MVCRISRDKISKIDIINVQGGITATQVYNKYKPDYMINLALYDVASGTNITYLRDEGVQSGYLFSNEGIGIVGQKELVWTTKDDTTVRDYVSGSPILVKDGEKCIEWGNKISTYVSGNHIRSAVGFNDKDIVLYTSDKKITLESLQEVMFDTNCKYAINLDGGGSSHLQEREKIYRKSTRANVSWLLIYLKEEKKVPIVCLDAGHGISTNGKRSPDGSLLEYEFNRDITNRIKAILEKHNVEVILTCTDTKDLTLTKRCKIANDKKADYFVSIHANAFYYKDENEKEKIEYNDISGWEIYVIAKGGKAEQLAKKIHKHSQELELKDRGIKESNFQVLRDTNMPAVLIEHGFYTNKEECEKLKDSNFRQKCAEADAKGILEQLEINYVPDINVNTKNKLILTIDKKEYKINGQIKKMEVAPRIENGRTLVLVAPLRDLGLIVEWNESTKEISIYYKEDK